MDYFVVGRQRRAGWVRETRGLHVPHEASSELARLRGVLSLLPPGSALTHLTAAKLHGWWLPPAPNSFVFAAITRLGDPRVRRETVNVWRPSIPWSRTYVDGLAVTSPADTLMACARDLGVLDLTCLVVAALRQGLDPDCLRSVILPRRPGSARLLAALELAEIRCESIYEVLMQVLHETSGIKVEAQHEITHHGRFVARGDLWIVGTRMLHEYDGHTHLTVAGHDHDLRRDRELLEAGWARRAYVARDVLTRAHQIIRDAESSLGLPHRPMRTAPWRALLKDSLFSPSGSSRLTSAWAAQRRPPRPSTRRVPGAGRG